MVKKKKTKKKSESKKKTKTTDEKNKLEAEIKTIEASLDDAEKRIFEIENYEALQLQLTEIDKVFKKLTNEILKCKDQKAKRILVKLKHRAKAWRNAIESKKNSIVAFEELERQKKNAVKLIDNTPQNVLDGLRRGKERLKRILKRYCGRRDMVTLEKLSEEQAIYWGRLDLLKNVTQQFGIDLPEKHPTDTDNPFGMLEHYYKDYEKYEAILISKIKEQASGGQKVKPGETEPQGVIGKHKAGNVSGEDAEPEPKKIWSRVMSKSRIITGLNLASVHQLNNLVKAGTYEIERCSNRQNWRVRIDELHPDIQKKLL